MKKVLLSHQFLGLVAVVLFGASAKADYVCSTYSGGRFFTEQSYSQNEGLNRVIDACQSSSSSDYSECIENAGCEDSQGGGNPGGGHQNGSGNINAYKQYCYSDLCTYQISWNTNWGSNSVVTVQIPGETEERLMSCEGRYGTAQAPWIARGKPYIFRMYESTNCSASVGYYQNPAATAQVFEYGDVSGSSNISGYQQYCNSSLCTFDIRWKVAYGNSSVVTVVDNNTGKEKLFACGAAQGAQDAPWIPASGAGTTFKLYASTHCSADVGRYEAPVATGVVRR